MAQTNSTHEPKCTTQRQSTVKVHVYRVKRQAKGQTQENKGWKARADAN